MEFYLYLLYCGGDSAVVPLSTQLYDYTVS